MLQQRAIKYAIYPTDEQKELFCKTFGCVRFVWNQMLSDCEEFLAATGKAFVPTPAKYKSANEFLSEPDSLALANAQMALKEAIKRHFEDKNIGWPSFKSKKKARRSYTTNNQINNGSATVFLGKDYIRLPKVGNVRAVIHRMPKANWRLKAATISQVKSGRYFCSVLFEFEQEVVPVLPTVDHGLGLDYSSPQLYVDSNGSDPEFPHFYRHAEAQLAVAQRRLAKMKYGSKNYYKQLHRVQVLHEHVANQRKDFLHKLSREIANSCDIVCVEDINLRGLAGSLHLGKSTNDNGFGMLREFLQYKLEEQGKSFIKIDRNYPSSQMCGNCGVLNPDVKDLSLRKWTCPCCGVHHDRDVNAARNILRAGIDIYYAPKEEPEPKKTSRGGRKSLRNKKTKAA